MRTLDVYAPISYTHKQKVSSSTTHGHYSLFTHTNPPIYPSIYPSIHPYTHSLIHPLIYPPTHLCIHALIHPATHPTQPTTDSIPARVMAVGGAREALKCPSCESTWCSGCWLPHHFSACVEIGRDWAWRAWVNVHV